MNKPYHVVIVSQYFYPEQFRINDIASDLVRRGYKVSVITGLPNYPDGNFYNGYTIRSRFETYNGIDIYRIPIIPRKKSKIMLGLNYISFVISGFFWSLLTRLKGDIIFTYEVSPMTQVLPAIWFAKKNNIPSIVYITDLWPENVEIVGGIKNKFILNLLGEMSNYIYENSDLILTSSKNFIDQIVKRNQNNKNVVFWPQYAEDFYFPLQKKFENEIPTDGVLNLTFAGNIGFAQGLEILPSVASKLRKQNIFVRFNLIGDGRYKEELVNIVKKTEVEEYFNFISSKNPNQIPQYFANSDASIISFTPNELFSMTIPAKLQSSLACGMPILASVDGESADIINESKSGFVAPAGNVEKFVEIIKKFIDLSCDDRSMLANNAREYFNNNYSKDSLMNKFEVYLNDCLSSVKE